jgi:hypothetical protein
MDHSPPPQPPDLTLQLPRDIYYQIVHTLCRALPPPFTASADDLSRRDNTAIGEVACLLAIGEVACLLPANAEEAEIAAQFVAANAQARVCLRLAQEHAADVVLVLRCTAPVRQDDARRSARSLLLRVQAVRHKREADNVATDKAAWIEYCAIGLMAEALGRAPAAPTAEPEPTPVPTPPPETDNPFALPTEAEQYAVTYPRHAALIRSLGGLPDNATSALTRPSWCTPSSPASARPCERSTCRPRPEQTESPPTVQQRWPSPGMAEDRVEPEGGHDGAGRRFVMACSHAHGRPHIHRSQPWT